jgi:hypothetical protein
MEYLIFENHTYIKTKYSIWQFENHGYQPKNRPDT